MRHIDIRMTIYSVNIQVGSVNTPVNIISSAAAPAACCNCSSSSHLMRHLFWVENVCGRASALCVFARKSLYLNVNWMGFGNMVGLKLVFQATHKKTLEFGGEATFTFRSRPACC